jgi:phytoene synthase
MTPDEYCQDKAAKSGSSFYYAFLFLTPERRHAITALYAFCREVSNVVDEATDGSVARIKLAWWRSQVDAMFEGSANHPVALAFSPYLQSCKITRESLVAIIDGIEMDLDQTRYLDWPGLQKYCRQAAGGVGRLSAAIYGYTNPQTLDYAETLGSALQMTAILRDVGDDARRGRIYLPVNELQQFGVKASEILNGEYSDRFAALMAFQAERTRGLYRNAMQLLPDADRRAQRAGLSLAAINHALLEEIESDDWRVLHQRISLTPLRKLSLAWRTWVGGGRGAVRRLSR